MPIAGIFRPSAGPPWQHSVRERRPDSRRVGVHAPIETPYGAAIQDTSASALSARAEVEAGTNLYRTGTLGRSQGVEAQFWSLEPPTAPGFAGRYGIPPENVANANFIEVGRLKPGTPFVTRRAPGVGTNPGGGIEVVVPEGGVEVGVFSCWK
jgi:filamentous hemagglutinin